MTSSFRYSMMAGPGDVPVQDASELIDTVRRAAFWDELSLAPEGEQFPRVGLSWHEGHGLVVHCFQDEASWGFFLVESPSFSAPEVDIVLGGQVQEKWPRQLFVSPELAREALDFFLQTGKQTPTLHWVETGSIPRETVWEGREGREAWLKSRRSAG